MAGDDDSGPAEPKMIGILSAKSLPKRVLLMLLYTAMVIPLVSPTVPTFSF
jgi:hypothetical protein